MASSQYCQVLHGCRSVFGQNLVELLAGLLHHGDAPLHLSIPSGARELLRRTHELRDGVAQSTDLIVTLPTGLPGEWGFIGGFRHTDVSEMEGPCPVLFGGSHHSLVFEHLQMGIDRTRARAPEPAAHLLQSAHDCVPVCGAVT